MFIQLDRGDIIAGKPAPTGFYVARKPSEGAGLPAKTISQALHACLPETKMPGAMPNADQLSLLA
jgi:hypothetical protein